jgi:hypothetical protein
MGRDDRCMQNFGRPKGKRQFRRPRCRWEDNIGIDLKEKGWKVVDWIHLVEDGNQ